MKAALRTWFLADTALSAAISGIYSFPAPQRASFATKPYIMQTRLSEENQELIDDELDLYIEGWQADILGATDKAVEAVKELFLTRMYEMGGDVLSGYLVASVSLEGVFDGSDLENLGGQDKAARKIIRFEIIRDRETRT